MFIKGNSSPGIFFNGGSAAYLSITQDISILCGNLSPTENEKEVIANDDVVDTINRGAYNVW